jgi:hypothetical protein
MVRVRVRVTVRINVKYYAIKVVPESFRIRVFFAKWAHIRGTYPWSFVTQICHSGQPNRGCDRKIFEVMTNVDPPNPFAHKERIWYDYLCPHNKEEMTRSTLQHAILKGE